MMTKEDLWEKKAKTKLKLTNKQKTQKKNNKKRGKKQTNIPTGANKNGY